MSSNPNEAPIPAQKNANVVGWAGFAVTAAILLYQAISFGISVIGTDIPKMLDGSLFNTELSLLGNITYYLALFMEFFFFLFPIITLVYLALRKKVALKLLIVFAEMAIISNAIVNMLLSSIVGWTDAGYLLQCGGFLVVDVLLLIFFWKSTQFRELFTR